MKDLHYLAGLIDGEGTITLTKIRSDDKFRAPVISLSSTTPAIIEYLKTHYGGYASTHKVYQAHHKQSWSWKLVYAPAVSLCKQLSGLLLEPNKNRRAKLIAEQYPLVTKRNGKYTADELKIKQTFEATFFHPSIP